MEGWLCSFDIVNFLFFFAGDADSFLVSACADDDDGDEGRSRRGDRQRRTGGRVQQLERSVGIARRER